jgi:phosphate:Na+ symporter
LNEDQSNIITVIKIANRKMVEIIRDVRELNKNVSYYLNSDNKYISKEYDKFRKKVIRVLRVIYLFRTQEDQALYFEKLLELKEEAKREIHSSNKSINKLIRDNLITVNMASSLVNDNDNVNDMIKKLISVAELLYLEKELFIENDEE